jgi:hypothetical protein
MNSEGQVPFLLGEAMKKILAIALLAFGASAFAQTNTVGGAQTTSCPNGATTCAGATSNSGSQASNQGNNQNITVNIPAAEQKDIVRTISETTVSGTQTVKNVPSVSGPALTTSNDTCMGAVSGSVNFAGFGVGAGTTSVDQNCVMLKNARELWNMGMKAAALARLCMDADNRTALEITGFKCPEVQRKENQQETVTDPYIRERLGLAPLK